MSCSFAPRAFGKASSCTACSHCSTARRHTSPARCFRLATKANKEDGYHTAPFLEPFVATVLTAAAVVGLTLSGVGSELLQQAQAATSGASTPYTEAKSISYGVLNGCGTWNAEDKYVHLRIVQVSDCIESHWLRFGRSRQHTQSGSASTMLQAHPVMSW